MILIAFILVSVVLAYKLAHDYRLWLDRKPVNHGKEWKLMALACIPSIVLCTIAKSNHTFVALASSSAMFAFYIWLFFDGIYNKLRGYSWWFTGSDDADDAASDNFLQRLKPWQHIAVKVGALVASITTYILT